MLYLVTKGATMTTKHSLRRSTHHVPLASRLLADDRRSPRPVDALRVRMALARPVDGEFASRLRAAVLEHEVTERLRGL